MRKDTKLYIFGFTALVIMLPFVLVGFIYKGIKTYFECGIDFAELFGEWIIEKLGDNDEA